MESAKPVKEKINACKNLDQLARVLRGADLSDIDTSALPTFGGVEPEDTCGIFSWDSDRILVQTGSLEDGGWEVQPRPGPAWELTYSPYDVDVSDDRGTVPGALVFVHFLYTGKEKTICVIPPEPPSPDCWLGYPACNWATELFDALGECAIRGAHGEEGVFLVDPDGSFQDGDPPG